LKLLTTRHYTQENEMDALVFEIAKHVGEQIRIRVGDQDYIGRIEYANQDTILMTTGKDKPVSVTIRAEAVDAVMVYVDEESNETY
jgi:hypothetical protein